MAFSIITGDSTSTGGGKTWDGEFGFIYEFIAIIERLLQVIVNFFNGLTGGGAAAPEGGEGEGEGEVTPA